MPTRAGCVCSNSRRPVEQGGAAAGSAGWRPTFSSGLVAHLAPSKCNPKNLVMPTACTCCFQFAAAEPRWSSAAAGSAGWRSILSNGYDECPKPCLKQISYSAAMVDAYMKAFHGSTEGNFTHVDCNRALVARYRASRSGLSPSH